LLSTTTMGAKAGFALMWLIIISTTVKVWVQMELARWTVLNGRPALEAYREVGPRWRGVGWINVVWILMDFAKILQRGGIIGGVVAAFSILWPVVGEPLSRPSLIVWTVVVLAVVITLLVRNKYRVVERVSFVMVVVFTVGTVILALGLPLTPFAYGMSDLASGFSFTIPAGAFGIAIAVFGLTGVGADEMTTYTYWCMEKGYAAWTGPQDGTSARERRAAGWIKVMQTDVALGWLITTVCSVSFYLLGAAVLQPQQLVPEGNDVITTLSRMYTDTLGEWAQYGFLVAAIAVLGSTLMASTAAIPRLWTNTLGILGIIDFYDMKQRNRLIRILTVVMPIILAATFLGIQAPLAMVTIGGIGGAVFLVAVVIAVWKLRYTGVPKKLRGGPLLTVMLVLASAAVVFLGVISFLEVFGIELEAA